MINEECLSQKKTKVYHKSLQKYQPYQIPSISFQFVDNMKTYQQKDHEKNRAKSQSYQHLYYQNKNQQKDIKNFPLIKSKIPKVIQKYKTQAIKNKKGVITTVQTLSNQQEFYPDKLKNISIILQKNNYKISQVSHNNNLEKDNNNTNNLQRSNETTLFNQTNMYMNYKKNSVKSFTNDNKINIKLSTSQENKLTQYQALSREKEPNKQKSCNHRHKLLTSNKQDKRVYKILSNSPKKLQKSLCSKIRNYCKTESIQNSQKSKQKKSSLSQNSSYYYKKNENKNSEVKIVFNYKKKSLGGMSKTIMINKIINLRKLFNQKYKKEKQTQLYENSHNSTNIMRNDEIPFQNNVLQNMQNTIRLTPFSFMNINEHKKMTLQELFKYQKKKMQNLKKSISQSNISQNNIQSTQLPQKQQMEPQCHKLWTKYQTIQDYINRISISDFLNETQHSIENRNIINQEDSKNQTIQGSINTECQQNLFKQNTQYKKDLKELKDYELMNISSFQKKKNYSSDISTFLNNLKNQERRICIKKQGGSHVATYKLDYMNKRKSQKPEINDLRHKYLYTNHKQATLPKKRRRFSKQQCHKYGISINPVVQQNQLQKNSHEFKEYYTESLPTQQFQIQRRNSFSYKKDNYKITANFHKLKNKKIGYIKTMPTENIQKKVQKSTYKKNSFKNLEPWQAQQKQFLPHSLNNFQIY